MNKNVSRLARLTIIVLTYCGIAIAIYVACLYFRASTPLLQALALALPFGLAAFVALLPSSEQASMFVRHVRWFPTLAGLLGGFYCFYLGSRYSDGDPVASDFFRIGGPGDSRSSPCLTIDVRQSRALSGIDVAGALAAALIRESVALTATALPEKANSVADFGIVGGATISLAVALAMALGAQASSKSFNEPALSPPSCPSPSGLPKSRMLTELPVPQDLLMPSSRRQQKTPLALLVTAAVFVIAASRLLRRR